MNINDYNAVNEIKALSLDMISAAKSGYPGISLSSAPIIYTLFARHMNINPSDPSWLNRDRFVLASGHASATLYATLHMCGFNITKEDLKQYRSIDAKLPGYPEAFITPGVDVTIGTSGGGIACAAGMALIERYERSILNKEDENQELIDYYTYCFCSDTDLMKGLSYEATSFVSKEKLNKFILLCDISGVTNDGSVDTTFKEDLETRFDALDFSVFTVKDATNLKSIDRALTNARKSKKPSVIFFHTIIGNGSRNENKNITFEGPLMDDDVFQIKRKLNITVAPFEVRKDSIVHIRNLINERVSKKYNEFTSYFNKIKTSGNDTLINLLHLLTNREMIIPFESVNFKVNDTYNENLLLTNHKILNLVANKCDFLLGGSSDVASTTKAYIDNTSINSDLKPGGRNINFGLRDEAMAHILNGMSLSGFKTFCSTKLINSSSILSGLRLACLMNLPITYIFTHDSILVGEDGASLECVEQISQLRNIPNNVVFRPSDINEILGVWEYISKNNKPVSIVLSNTTMPKIPNTNSLLVKKGAYIIKKEERKLDGIIISSGKELLTALNIAIELKNENLDIRVVSMPSMELFLKEDRVYKEEILPKNVKTIIMEPSKNTGFGDLKTNNLYILGINDFGFSGHPLEVLKKCGYDYENLKMKVARLLINND